MSEGGRECRGRDSVETLEVLDWLLLVCRAGVGSGCGIGPWLEAQEGEHRRERAQEGESTTLSGLGSAGAGTCNAMCEAMQL